MDAGQIRMFPVYFEDGTLSFQDDDGLESDSWRRSKHYLEPQIFRNVENYILVVKLESPTNQMAAFEYMTDPEMDDESGVKFTIHPFEDTEPRGQTVAVTTRTNGKTYCMYAEKQENGEMKVSFKAVSLPEHISGEASNFIFFQIPFTEGDDKFYKFESTLERGYFLAFENGKGSRTRRLIMKRIAAADEVDETIKVSHSSK